MKRKAMHIKSWKRAMNGNVERSKLRLPNESMVQTAGNAKKKLMIPKPIEIYDT